MATIELRLSNKVQKNTGLSEVMICLRYSGKDLSSGSGIFVKPTSFEYYIDRKSSKSPKVPIPPKKNTSTKEKALKNGWPLRKSGEIVLISSNALQTDDVKKHNAKVKQMTELKTFILDAFGEVNNPDTLKSLWLKDVVSKFHDPDREVVSDPAKKSFYELVEEFITKPHGKSGKALMPKPASDYRLLMRTAARYEEYSKATGRKRRSWSWSIDRVTRDDIEDFFDYIDNEKELLEANPDLMIKLLDTHPISTRPGRNKLQVHAESTLIKLKKKLKTLFVYFYERGLTKNRPFDGITIGAEKYGTPIYITINERNQIAGTDLSAGWAKLTAKEKKDTRASFDTVAVLRDIFVFQCFVGCRVGDLSRLTEDNINNGILIYTPQKTESSSARQARVPLHPKALALIDKYRGVDSMGRIFPFVARSHYNYAIKTIFKMAGITRKVEWRNPRTGKNEMVPINTIASSHMARRTFIGNAYFKVQDPNLIGKMSGHVEGSTAFSRYRKIEDETLKNVIDLIG